MQFILHDLHAACKAIGLKTLPQDSRSESLFLHLLVQKPPHEQFAQPQARHFHRLSQIRSWLYKGGAVALLGCLLFAGREMVGVLQSRSATSDLLLQAESDLLKYQAIQKTYPPMPVSTDGLRAVINRFESLEKRSVPVESLYLAVSRALEEAPRVDLERLQWQLSANPDEGVKAVADARKPAGGAPAAAPNAMYETAVVHGLLPASLAADQRGQLETVNAFADALRKNPALQVNVVQMPFDIESGKSLKSSSEAEQSLAKLKFVIHLSRKL